ncbi:MAG: flagellar biosynthetic protein FlhB [Chlamydiales bacterium]|jgi:flagellar biosynthetic protein FlhB
MAEGTEKDDKTEDGTAKRRQDGRDKGQVAYSSESVAAVMLIGTLGSIYIGGGQVASAAAGVLTRILTGLGAATDNMELAGSASLIVTSVEAVLPGLAVIVIPTLVLGLLTAFMQVGVQISPKVLEVDGSKLNPLKGLKRMFSARSVMRTGLAALKIGAIGAAVLVAANLQMPRVTVLAGLDPRPAIMQTGGVLMRSFVAGVVVMLLIAAVDLFFQRMQHDKDMRMSKKEIKDENKDTEGDPHVKSRIRQIQREVASRRMMADVPDATVVITNPTHFAVALAYDRGDANLGAPRVVAKGVDQVALKIREIAKQHGVPIYEAPPLARALHAQTEIGDTIPADLFQAVAGVLAYVYRLHGGASANQA